MNEDLRDIDMGLGVLYFQLAKVYAVIPSRENTNRATECFINGLSLMPDELKEQFRGMYLTEMTKEFGPDMMEDEYLKGYINAVKNS